MIHNHLEVIEGLWSDIGKSIAADGGNHLRALQNWHKCSLKQFAPKMQVERFHLFYKLSYKSSLKINSSYFMQAGMISSPG